ncbi:type VII toxin-antitoxin system HepT family RNase toxin [Desulfotomaculum sp. 1211_IL3151]|uniref:type VII toxin-antitoxin system HepT family RNase toxin n=1 Tax=Desulfotomaculum sp. 1211_IL3151 TaxID=3084055 RepID=UPI002FD9EA43
MYNNSLIFERVSIIANSVSRLKILADTPLDQFRIDEDAIDIAENRLRKALEALFDLGRHVVIKSGLGVPADYRSVIEKLREAGCLPVDFAQNISGIAGYRNRIIHDYNKVTPEELYEIMQNRLTDLTQYCKYIIDFTNKKR